MPDLHMLIHVQACTLLTIAQLIIKQQEALETDTLLEAEQEAREHTLEQWYTIAAFIRTQYPGVFPLLLTKEGKDHHQHVSYP